MKSRWNGQFKKVEENNDWFWWPLFGAVVFMIVLVILKMLGKI